MFAVARQQKIKELLLKHKQIDVTTLAATLGVTEVTARRDLDVLEKEGFATKTHGGVIINEAVMEENRETPDNCVSPEIREIGESAALLIDDKDAVFIGGGLTCQQIALNLKNKQRVMVMTNDLMVARELTNTNGVISVVTGGNTLAGTNVLLGDLALRALEGIHFNKVIISVAGVSFSHGFTTDTVEEAQLYKQLFSISNETIIVADYNKFNKIGFAHLTDLTSIHKLVTNKEVDPQFKEFFFQHNIKVYTPFEVEELTTWGESAGE
ncbi:MAG TPA: DeoR/GlpR transcriptional regulator [Firmicutes bacterium]|jgi:DeoR family transcriptional regulator, fructose operon transcriptional repressor|nr:DeoR/GlpR transcriptional regulator [Bacillota bacterium]